MKCERATLGLAFIVAWLGLALATVPASAQTLEELMAHLPEGSYSERAEVVAAIGATGDELAVALLEALGEGDLHQRKEDGAILRVTGRGSKAQGFDPLTGAELGPVPSRSTEAIKVNNSLRRVVRAALGTLTLSHPDPARRLGAAAAAFGAPDPEQIEALDAAIARETDPGVAKALAEARALALLETDAPLGERVAAVGTVAGRGGHDALGVLTPLTNAEEPEIAEAAAGAVAAIERTGRCGLRRRTSGSGCRSARFCCWRRSGSQSPSG